MTSASSPVAHGRSWGRCAWSSCTTGGRRGWSSFTCPADRYKTNVINPGEPADGWLDFHPESGLDRLRDLIAQAEESGNGVRVTGQVGLTSHVGDLLRRDVPARLDLR